MHIDQTIDENRKALRRIVALLLSLAGLAERAAGRSPVVCRLVLWLLRPGEAIARAYVDALAPGGACARDLRDGAPDACRPPADWPCAPGSRDAAAQALRLAQCFRALAAGLAALADDDLAASQSGLRTARRSR